MAPIIALTTDFGLADSYVGQVKGVILGIAPAARLVDVTHAVPPQDVSTAALILDECVATFPPGTVHLVVVDPGVGTARRMVAAEIGEWRFVAPDNGVLAAVARRYELRGAVELADRRWWRANPSATFHGRDIMGPVAAHWAAGIDLAEFGPVVGDGLVDAPLVEPAIEKERGIVGRVVRCDGFGNLVTNIPGWWFAKDRTASLVTICGRKPIGLRTAYGEAAAGELVALVGSHGFVEIAVNLGDARNWGRTSGPKSASSGGGGG